MATTRSMTRDLIKTAKTKVDYVHTTLLKVEEVVTGELNSDRLQQLYIQLKELRTMLVDTMAQIERWEKVGMSGLPNRDLATICLHKIADLLSEIESRAAIRASSAPIRSDDDGQRITSIFGTGSVSPRHFRRDPGISGPVTTVQAPSVETANSELFAIPKTISNTLSGTAGPSGSAQYTAGLSGSAQYTAPSFIDYMTPKVIKKLDFNFLEQPNVTFANNPEVPIMHSTINPLSAGFTFPTTSGQPQTGLDRIVMASSYRKPFNMKWADKVQKFDGKFENFHTFINAFNQFIYQTDAVDAGKLLLLREKLDPFSLGLIAGIDGPQYQQAYQILTKFYSASFPLQQKLKAKVEALPRAERWHQTEIMRSNLAVIKDVYNTLSTSGNNRSFLETDFFYTVAAKFPDGAVTNIMQRYGSELTISKYLNDLNSYIEQSEQQRIILCRTDYVMYLNKPKQETIARARSVPNRSNFSQPNPFRRVTFQNRNRFSNRVQSRPTMPIVTFPNSQRPTNVYNTPSTSNNNFSNRNVQGASRTSGTKQCFFCKGNHIPSQCPRPSGEKIRILNTLKRCVRCFSSAHMINECIHSFNCRTCNGRHNTSVCHTRDNNNNPITSMMTSEPTKLEQIKISLNDIEFEGLFDTGSTHSFISYDICDVLNMNPEPCDTLLKQAVTWTSIMGKTTLKTKIGQMTKEHQFYILPQTHYLIIGIDIIDRFKLMRKPGGKISQLVANEEIPIQAIKIKPTTSSANVIELQDFSQIKGPLKEVIRKFRTVFTNSGEIGSIRTDTCRINLLNEVPINLRPYRISQVDQKRVDDQVKLLLEKELIRPSKSNYSFPVVLVDKKDDGKKTRLCVDYRKLNDITITECYPMPLIQDIEDRMLNSTIFSTFDIASGFHHIPIEESDKYKTAFSTMTEHFEWNVMPFGLKNAPAIFQRIVYNILKHNRLTNFSHNYIDDIIVFSGNYNQHIEHLKRLFAVLKDNNIILKFSKCKFGLPEVCYLGHQISFNTIRPLKSNKQAIVDFPPPKDLKSLRRFLGKIGFYQRFIPNKTELLTPLYELLKKDQAFNWTALAETAFNKVIEVLSSDLVLHIFDPSKAVILITDASNVGIGAVLKQKDTELDDDQDMVTVGYFSRKLLPYQVNYSATEKECLAIVESIAYWHHYLYGKEFLIRTDHKPLKYINSISKPNTRILNWALRLSQYNFKIEYVPGSENVEADFLSRNPNFEVNLLTLQEISDIHANIPVIPPGCVLFNGCYVKYTGSRRRYYLPDNIAIEIVKRYHEEQGHIGQKQTALHFSQKYYNSNQNRFIQNCIRQCEICLQAKKPRKKMGLLHHLGPADEPFRFIHIDTIGGFRESFSQLRYFHVAIDSFSRYVWGITSKTQNVSDFQQLYNKISQDGHPQHIVCDRYPALNSSSFREFLLLNNTQIIYIPVTHPSSNGMIERFVQTVVERLRCKKLSMPNRSWARLAMETLVEYNSTIHTVTRYAPSFLMSGEDPDEYYLGEDLIEARMMAYERSCQDHNRNKRYYDRRRVDKQFEPGDWVFAKIADELNRRKLDPRYEGPFEIITRYSSVVYGISVDNHEAIVHIENLKPANAQVLDTEESDVEEEDLQLEQTEMEENFNERNSVSALIPVIPLRSSASTLNSNQILSRRSQRQRRPRISYSPS